MAIFNFVFLEIDIKNNDMLVTIVKSFGSDVLVNEPIRLPIILSLVHTMFSSA